MTTTVKMERDGKQADVHPDEVGNYEIGGWLAAEKQPAKKKAASKPKTTKKTDAE